MKVHYLYKGKSFSDIRDIVHNNILEPDYDYILNEYIPFQYSFSRRTFFKGVTIGTNDVRYSSESTEHKKFEQLFYNGISEYMTDHGLYSLRDREKLGLALSGGVDSTILATELYPKKTFTGAWCSVEELNSAGKVSESIKSEQSYYDVTEDEFIRAIPEVIEAECTPIGGFGGPADLVLLKKFTKDNPDIQAVMYGYGGDEVFLGYPWNHHLINVEKSKERLPTAMSNYASSISSLMEYTIPISIMYSFYRGCPENFNYYISKSFTLAELSTVKGVLNQILHANINYMLPSFIHVMRQFGKYTNVEVLNPLSNRLFIENALSINTPYKNIPKHQLRTLLEDDINCKHFYKKEGNPVPVLSWHNLDTMMSDNYYRFIRRMKEPRLDIPYDGINRWSWGYVMAEMVFNRYFDK